MDVLFKNVKTRKPCLTAVDNILPNSDLFDADEASRPSQTEISPEMTTSPSIYPQNLPKKQKSENSETLLPEKSVELNSFEVSFGSSYEGETEILTADSLFQNGERVHLNC